MLRHLLAAILFVVAATHGASATGIDIDAPITASDDALPLGNGLTGGLLWGGGRAIRLSLNRGDLWDLRRPAIVRSPDWTYATLRRLVREHNESELIRRFDDPYFAPTPTKLPPVRLAIGLPAALRARAFHLDFTDAEARVDLAGTAAPLRAFFSAVAPVTYMRVPTRTVRITLSASPAIAKLGYAPPAITHGSLADGNAYVALSQRTAGALRYAVVVGEHSDGAGTTLAVAFPASHDGTDPALAGRRTVRAALATSYVAARAPHLAWWRRFWQTSRVRVPDASIQRSYDFAKYTYGATSRRNAPPISLQGVWTVDDGGLPPWKSDFHNDLNTQMSYLAYLDAGLYDAGASFIDFNSALMPTYQRFARTFYGVPGAVVPGVEALDGAALGGWSQYALSPTMGAWVAQTFYLQWRYARDDAFLRTRAYPFCSAIGTALGALLIPGADGTLRLPLSSSPEIFDNTLRAWLPPDSNFDQALLRYLFDALTDMARAQGDAAGARRWHQLAGRLAPLDVTRDKSGARVLTIAPGVPVGSSHRHFSHLMAIYPLGLLSVHRSAAERALVNASLATTLSFGTSGWSGWSFPWMAMLLARAGQPEPALHELTTFVRAAVGPNGFHQNGDIHHTGAMSDTGGIFTLEGNLEVMQAVHEMLLQSTDGGVRIFPATSARWKNVGFERLRAEGGFVVSALRTGGRTTSVRIAATKKMELVLADPFGAGVRVRWSRPDVRRTAGDYRVRLSPGDVLTGQPTSR